MISNISSLITPFGVLLCIVRRCRFVGLKNMSVVPPSLQDYPAGFIHSCFEFLIGLDGLLLSSSDKEKQHIMALPFYTVWDKLQKCIYR